MFIVFSALVVLFTGVAASGDRHENPAPPDEDQPIQFIPRRYESAPDFEARILATARAQQVPGQAQLYVLVPRSVAYTTQAQPSLYWYLSQTVDHPIKIHLATEAGSVMTLHLQGSKLNRGIQHLDLSQRNVRLQPGVAYDWVVTIMADADRPSRNAHARTTIWRVPHDQIDPRLFAPTARQRAAAAAELGLWIDALTEIGHLIRHAPEDFSKRQSRADLLTQVGFDTTIEPQPDSHYTEIVTYADER